MAWRHRKEMASRQPPTHTAATIIIHTRRPSTPGMIHWLVYVAGLAGWLAAVYPPSAVWCGVVSCVVWCTHPLHGLLVEVWHLLDAVGVSLEALLTTAGRSVKSLNHPEDKVVDGGGAATVLDWRHRVGRLAEGGGWAIARSVGRMDEPQEQRSRRGLEARGRSSLVARS